METAVVSDLAVMMIDGPAVGLSVRIEGYLCSV